MWQALALDWRDCRAVALVGGGGKTSTMYAMAHEAWAAGQTVVITTSTHIMPHPRICLTEDAAPSRLRALVERERIVTVGRFERPDKLSGVGVLEEIKTCVDVVLLEADGARQHPLKVPKEGEPVLPPGVDAVIGVAGMDCVGMTIRDGCHRLGLVCEVLEKEPWDIITTQDVVKILCSERGARKGVTEEMAYRCVLNKADTPARRAAAQEIAAMLQARDIPAAITQYSPPERGGRAFF
ncbi:MAG: putative selenium-dependent hydroxylase accessory protein YqeC [Oscillospiraceae bacterium]|nr:putative selenium-dependent hydroxylase accessory protein YqeC [Oscillospiraceae bacterium]